VLYSSLVMTFVIVVFAEVLPKTVAFNAPDHFALAVARPIAWTVRLLTPALAAIEALVNWLLRSFGMQLGEGPAIISPHEELRRRGRPPAPRRRR